MEVKNKKVAFLGDSITEGSGASTVENRYTDVFARISGAKTYNYGIGGTRIAPQHVKSNERFDRDFILRAEEIEKDADVIVVSAVQTISDTATRLSASLPTPRPKRSAGRSAFFAKSSSICFPRLRSSCSRRFTASART